MPPAGWHAGGMDPSTSCGLLLWRLRDGAPEVLIGHMGGPYWARRDAGAWSIPKGLAEADEDVLATAVREFTEELGQPPPPADPERPDVDLGAATTRGKTVRVVARHGDLDPDAATGGTFTMEWPPRSGEMRAFPEVDRAEWCDLGTAAERLAGNQRMFIARLAAAIS